MRPDRLPVVVDSPTPQPGLGFDRYIEGISAAILGGTPARYTVGLYGQWGSGKSSILAGIRRALLDSTGTQKMLVPGEESPYVVEFDAWRYERAETLIFPMLYAVQRAIESRAQATASDRAKGVILAVKNVLSSLELSFMGISLGLERNAGSASNEGFHTPFDGLAELSSSLGKKNRIVILIDDLDRCSPEGVVSVLEAIHVLTDVEGIVFVLALDYEYLISSIRSKYPGVTDPHRFIEKIIQVPFHIPRAQLKKESIGKVVPSWPELQQGWFSQVSEDVIEDIIGIGLRSNPRQIKRLFNTYLLARYMEWEATAGASGGDDAASRSEILIKVLGLQLVWPDEFQELHRGCQQAASERGRAGRFDEVPAFSHFVRAGGEENGAGMAGGAVALHDDGSEAQGAVDSLAPGGTARLPHVFAESDQRRKAELQKANDLSDYLLTVFEVDMQVGDLLPLMELAERIVDTQPERGVEVAENESTGAESEPSTSFELSQQRSSPELLDLARVMSEVALEAALEINEEAVPLKTRAYAGVRLVREGMTNKTTVMTYNLRSRRNQLVMYLPGMEKVQIDPGFMRDVTAIGHAGVGELEIVLKPHEGAQIERAKELIRKSVGIVASRMT